MMQGRPPPMDFYSAGMHPSGECTWNHVRDNYLSVVFVPLFENENAADHMNNPYEDILL